MRCEASGRSGAAMARPRPSSSLLTKSPSIESVWSLNSGGVWRWRWDERARFKATLS